MIIRRIWIVTDMVFVFFRHISNAIPRNITNELFFGFGCNLFFFYGSHLVSDETIRFYKL